MADKRTNWLQNPCRPGGSQHFRVGSGPLPSRGSPMFSSTGQNHKWPTSGRIGYIAPVVKGFPNASKRRTKSEVAPIWADWLHNARRLGCPHYFKGGYKIKRGTRVAQLATSPLPSGGPQTL